LAAGYNRAVKGQESESSLLLEKIKEQVSLARHLVSLVPASALEWRPPLMTGTEPDQAPEQHGKHIPEVFESAAKGASSTQGPGGNNGLLRVGDLLGHLLDCVAGFCALLCSINRGRLSHFEKLRDLPVNHFCLIEEAQERLVEYMSYIEEGFGCLDDSDLSRLIPTVFVPQGEPVLTLVLGNLEHLINHKYQLFIYLRLLGVSVGTKDLYRIRGTGVESKGPDDITLIQKGGKSS
jgi:hypothetical protein